MTRTTLPAGFEVAAVLVSAGRHTLLDTAEAGILFSARTAVDDRVRVLAVSKEGIRTRIDFRSATTAVAELFSAAEENRGSDVALEVLLTADGNGM